MLNIPGVASAGFKPAHDRLIEHNTLYQKLDAVYLIGTTFTMNVGF